MEFTNSQELIRSAKRGYLENVRELVKSVDVNVTDSLGLTALHHAAKKGHSSVVEFLLQSGAIVNAKDRYGWTPLHYAVQLKKDEVIFVLRALLEAGTDVNAISNNTITPLHCAAKKGRNLVVEVLLEAHASINASDKDGWTPLHEAVVEGRYTIVKTLLEAGADYTLRLNKSRYDVSEMTPKELARANGFNSIVKLLQEYEDTPDVKEPE